MHVLPSRQRPDALKRFFEGYIETEADSKGVVLLDIDDPKLHEYEIRNFPKDWIAIAGIRHDGLASMFNEAFHRFPNEPWYSYMTDDTIPRTKHWDKILIEKAGNDGVAYPDDGINGEKLAGIPVIGGDLVRDMGWLALPGLKRIYIDNAITEVARRAGKLHYCPEVLIEHMHFSNGKSAFDDTYAKPDSHLDKQRYEEWLSTLSA